MLTTLLFISFVFSASAHVHKVFIDFPVIKDDDVSRMRSILMGSLNTLKDDFPNREEIEEILTKDKAVRKLYSVILKFAEKIGSYSRTSIDGETIFMISKKHLIRFYTKKIKKNKESTS